MERDLTAVGTVALIERKIGVRKAGNEHLFRVCTVSEWPAR